MKSRPRHDVSYERRGPRDDLHTSPSSLSIRKLRLLILSWGVPGKQKRQLESVEKMSSSVCAMAAASARNATEGAT